MKKIKSFSIILMMLLSALSVAFIPSSTGSVATELPDYEPMDYGPKIRNADYEINGEIPLTSEIYSSSSSSGPRSAGVKGEVKLFLYLDDYYGYYDFAAFECRAVGIVAEVWVQLDLSYPEGDPREYPNVTDTQVNYLLDEFDYNIYPIDTQYFGTPNSHNGSAATLPGMVGLPADYYYNLEARNIIMV